MKKQTILPFIFTWLAIIIFFICQSCQKKDDQFEAYKIMEKKRPGTLDCHYTAVPIKYGAVVNEVTFWASCDKYALHQTIYIKL